MGTGYTHLSCEERTTLMGLLAEGKSPSAIARALERDRSTIGRELARNGARRDPDTGERANAYDAQAAHARAEELAHAPGPKKLAPESPLFAIVREQLEAGWSPEQVAGYLQCTYPSDRQRTVCHETIYTAIYVLPRGELRREMVAALRQSRGRRRPRSRGQDRRGRIADMVSLHTRPPEVEDRQVPGHWEGDLIKGKANKSCVGTLIERTSRLVLLARMDGACAEAALAGFTRALNRVPEPVRKTLTYDQGKEMACHKQLEAATGINVYFADPHSPWQRASNENVNGLLRQYLPKGTDLSQITQTELDAIAWKLNTRPRKMFGFRCPVEVFAEHFGRC